MKNNIRTSRRAAKRKQKRTRNILWGIGIFLIIAFLTVLLWPSPKELVGETIPIMPNYLSHVLEGEDPGPYNSNPPTSGPHYDGEFEAGFYEPDSPQAQLPYPEGYIGHNLEHGYVIFWYNCATLDENSCENLKSQIKDAMSKSGQTKLIAFPRESIDTPVVMTAWGKLFRFQTFDQEQAIAFISANINQAPEPNAP